ncbi:SIS domain-containing protein [bacterium]|nr:SIS domain-containing protein [bacterium]
MLQIKQRLSEYANRVFLGLESLDEKELQKILEILEVAYIKRIPIFVCGNGGSLTMSDHFYCDHAKGTHYDAELRPKIEPLTTGSILTAIANDIGYDDVFSFQLNIKGDAENILIAISASGNSPNIVNAIKKAKQLQMKTIAFVGFDGGEALKLADHVLHIKENNYGIIEDCHQCLMHILAQHIRSLHNLNNKIKL